MPGIENFHAHIYFDAAQVEEARALAEEARARFGVSVGRFHPGPVGPHPRGSVQLTLDPARFADFALWAPFNRRGFTLFVHPSTGDDRTDHTDHVIWFGPSEKLDLSVLDD